MGTDPKDVADGFTKDTRLRVLARAAGDVWPTRGGIYFAGG
jgi:hypothetical protein